VETVYESWRVVAEMNYRDDDPGDTAIYYNVVSTDIQTFSLASAIEKAKDWACELRDHHRVSLSILFVAQGTDILWTWDGEESID